MSLNTGQMQIIVHRPLTLREPEFLIRSAAGDSGWCQLGAEVFAQASAAVLSGGLCLDFIPLCPQRFRDRSLERHAERSVIMSVIQFHLASSAL